MSIVSALIATVVAKLSEAPAVAPQIGRVSLRPVARSAQQAVVVRPLHSQAGDASLSPGYPVTWNTVFAVECYSRSPGGTAPDAAVDVLASAIYQRLMADINLGGAVSLLSPQGVVYDFDVDGEQTACATFTFVARQISAPTTF